MSERRRLRRCFGRWPGPAYFAPAEGDGSWKALVPDGRAGTVVAPIVAAFDRLDRSASFGAAVHRDSIWLVHLFAACAVVTAVSGEILHSKHWGVAELVLLALIAFLIGSVCRSKLRKRWMTARLAAEQLRIARLVLPLLVVPPGLQTEAGATGEDAAEALAAMKRAVRDQGVLQVDLTSADPAAMARWAELIVVDQARYHHDNATRLHHAEQRLDHLTFALFGLVVVGVVLHFVWPTPWLLLLTAAGPACAAALHGVGTRLGLVHRTELSRSAAAALDKIAEKLRQLPGPGPADRAGMLVRVRPLAFEAAEVMATETATWHHLVRRQEDKLPT